MMERDTNLVETADQQEAAWDEGSPEVTSDLFAEELGEAFIEAATAGRDPQERQDPEGVAALEPEEAAITTVVDEVLLTAFDESSDGD